MIEKLVHEYKFNENFNHIFDDEYSIFSKQYFKKEVLYGDFLILKHSRESGDCKAAKVKKIGKVDWEASFNAAYFLPKESKLVLT